MDFKACPTVKVPHREKYSPIKNTAKCNTHSFAIERIASMVFGSGDRSDPSIKKTVAGLRSDPSNSEKRDPDPIVLKTWYIYSQLLNPDRSEHPDQNYFETRIRHSGS